jgi:lysophospholipase L1-like esterase
MISGIITSRVTKLKPVTLTITGVDPISPVNKNLGVRFDALALPSTVGVGLNDSSTRTLNINWIEGSFDEWTAGAQTIYGSLVLPYGVANLLELQASISVTVQSKTPSQIGVLFDDNFARGSLGADYVTVGPASWTVDGVKLNTVNGTTAYTSRLHREYYQCFEEWEQEVTYTFNTAPGVGTYGIALGSRDQLGSWTALGTHNMSTDANTGKARIIKNNVDTATVLATSAGSVVPQAAVSYRAVLSRIKVSNEFRYTFTITKLSNSSTTNITWDENITTSGNTSYANATGRFTLWSFGGNVDITNWKCTVFDNKNVDAVIMGDSITHGLNATDLSTRFAANIVSNYSVSGGSSDRTEQGLIKLQNIIDYNPTVVFLNLITNDVAGAVATATRRANYIDIVEGLEAQGIRVIILLQIPRNGVNIASENTWISGRFPNNTIIDNYTPLASGTNLNASYTGDNVHPNQAGHDVMITTILAGI